MGVHRVRPPADIYPKISSTTKMTTPTSRSDTYTSTAHAWFAHVLPVPPSVTGVVA